MSPEQHHVLTLARDWRSAATGDLLDTGPNRLIHRFVKLWIALNALYAMYADRETHERHQLRLFAKWPPFTASHARHLGEQVYGRAVEVLANPGIYNFRAKRSRWITISPRCLAPEVLFAVYQIRCNLFHGRKHPADMRDLQLIQAGSTIVARWLDDLLEYGGPWSPEAA